MFNTQNSGYLQNFTKNDRVVMKIGIYPRVFEVVVVVSEFVVRFKIQNGGSRLIIDF